MNEEDDSLLSPLGITLDENKIINYNDNSVYRKSKEYKKKTKFDKIIIPYNFQKNCYYITDNEIEGYENKEFLLNTLHNYNSQQLFKFDVDYSPTCCERLIYIPIIIIFIIIIYILVIFVIIFMFNPFVLYLSMKCLGLVFSGVKSYKNTLYEKFKKKAILKQLNETNKLQYCQDHKIRWKLGVSGYWLEIERVDTISELQER
jgi:hypothetical protein